MHVEVKLDIQIKNKKKSSTSLYFFLFFSFLFLFSFLFSPFFLFLSSLFFVFFSACNLCYTKRIEKAKNHCSPSMIPSKPAAVSCERTCNLNMECML